MAEEHLGNRVAKIEAEEISEKRLSVKSTFKSFEKRYAERIYMRH